MSWLLSDENVLQALDGSNALQGTSQVQLTLRESNNKEHLQTFSIEGWPTVQALVYQRKLNEFDQARIRNMVELAVSPLMRCHFSWPIDTIVNDENDIIGCLTSFIEGLVPLSTIFASKKSSLAYKDRLRIAMNLCVALALFHQAGIVFGDLTSETVLIETHSCRVFLDPGLDAQLLDEAGRGTPCILGTSEYLAPEIQRWLAQGGALCGIIHDYSTYNERSPEWYQYFYQMIRPSSVKPFSRSTYSSGYLAPDIGSHVISQNLSIKFNQDGQYRAYPVPDSNERLVSVFSQNTDLFALGVILFALIHNGRHPFSNRSRTNDNISHLGTYDPPSQRPQVNRIILGEQPRSKIFQRQYQPAYRCLWDQYNLRKSFEACFDTEETQTAPQRPSASEWYSLLDEQSKNLRCRLGTVRQRILWVNSFWRGNSGASDQQLLSQLRRQLPLDTAGSESLTSPRVFWGTTTLFALCVGLYTLAGGFELISSSLSYVGYPALRTSPIALFVGAFAGLFIANYLAGAHRGLIGYRPIHYMASFFASSLLCLVLGLIVGGIG